MTKIILDNDLRTKLLDLRTPLELCDESGAVVGRVFPAMDLSQFDQWEPPIDEEEMQRREQSLEKRYTTSQVLAHLEQLGCSE